MTIVDGRFSNRTNGTRVGVNNLNATMIYYTGNGDATSTNNSGRFALELNRTTNVARAYMDGFNNAAATFGPQHINDVAAYTKTALLGNWNGMPAQP